MHSEIVILTIICHGKVHANDNVTIVSRRCGAGEVKEPMSPSPEAFCQVDGTAERIPRVELKT